MAIKLKVYTEAPNSYRGILEDTMRGHIASMVFGSSDDMIRFIVEMGIDWVAVLIHSQSTISYGYRLDDQVIKGSIALYQSGKRGRKREISVSVE